MAAYLTEYSKTLRIVHFRGVNCLVKITSQFSKTERLQEDSVLNRKRKHRLCLLLVKLYHLKRGSEGVFSFTLPWGCEVYIQGPEVLPKIDSLICLFVNHGSKLLLNTIFP